MAVIRPMTLEGHRIFSGRVSSASGTLDHQSGSERGISLSVAVVEADHTPRLGRTEDRSHVANLPMKLDAKTPSIAVLEQRVDGIEESVEGTAIVIAAFTNSIKDGHATVAGTRLTGAR
jgi:hypothetical protein